MEIKIDRINNLARLDNLSLSSLSLPPSFFALFSLPPIFLYLFIYFFSLAFSRSTRFESKVNREIGRRGKVFLPVLSVDPSDWKFRWRGDSPGIRVRVLPLNYAELKKKKEKVGITMIFGARQLNLIRRRVEINDLDLLPFLPLLFFEFLLIRNRLCVTPQVFLEIPFFENMQIRLHSRPEMKIV